MTTKEILADKKKKETYVGGIFSSIAPVYDFLNTFFTFGRDRSWRKTAVKKMGLDSSGKALDLATGTGELALAIAKMCGPGVQVFGADFCQEMLDRAAVKIKKKGLDSQISLLLANAEELPFPDNSFDAAVIGFGLRNVAGIEKTFLEMSRVVKPGGRVVSLELTQPRGRLMRYLYAFYAGYFLPFVGSLVSRTQEPYQYLPDSIMRFYSPEELKVIMEKVGLTGVDFISLSGGVAHIHVGTKA